MNNKETQISNMSYTNKDFNSIYSELLDTAKNLTNKWDPSQSNESDPGVVLIKEDAIIGDKNNYNIDKNVLELFPLSVTQTGNARKIYDFAGYQMHWYRAANTTMSVKYTGDFPVQDGTTNKLPFTIPYGTAFTNEDGSVVYTYVENDYPDDSPLISDGDRTGVLYCLQGVLQEYDINGSTVILYSNLDSQRRLFFPYQNVAENGIFIKTHGTNAKWTKVDNIESQPVGSLVFKFGVMPNTNVCYIQFPQDIEYIIGEGLYIQYLTTLGLDGNVKAGVIKTLSSEVVIQVDTGVEVTLTNDNLVMSNKDATNSGKDPEDLDTAYENYKKTVGTFNTLVACRDYENALYNSEAVSNCVVSDRTNDLNATWTTMEAKGLDSYSVNRVQEHQYTDVTFDPDTPIYIKDGYINNFNVSNGTMTVSYSDVSLSAFDLVLYLLQPVSNINGAVAYNKTFTKTVEDESSLGEAVTYLNKSCQHNFKDPRETLDNTVVINASDETVAAPYLYKNFYTLKGTLITYSKVNNEEAQAIEDNVRLALYKRFNARNVNFGEALLYEDIVKTIKEADSRIKSITLNEDLDYDLRGLRYGDSVGDIDSSIDETDEDFTSAKIVALVKMILRGNVPLYNFNEDFVVKFGETNTSITGAEGWADNPGASGSQEFSKYIESISTEVTLEKDGNDQFVIDDPNVNVVLYTNSYIDTTTYTYYATVKNNLQESVPVGQIVKIDPSGASTSALTVSWKDENNVKRIQDIPSGTIIEITIDGRDSIAAGDTVSLGVSGTLVIKQLNQDTKSLASGASFIYFTNDYVYNPDNGEYTFTLMRSGETERILDVDEYLIYTNKARDELVILGSGTKIEREDDSDAISYKSTVTPNVVLTEGTAVTEDISWQELPYGLTITELKIVTIGSGYSFYTGAGVTWYDSEGAVASGDVITKEYQYVHGDSELYYVNNNDNLDITQIPKSPDNWYIFSRLNVQASKDVPQTLTDSEEVELHIKDITTIPPTFSTVVLTDCVFKTNKPAAIVGGDNISALITHVGDSGVVHDYSLKVLSYDEVPITSTPSDIITEDANGNYLVSTTQASSYQMMPFAVGHTLPAGVDINFDTTKGSDLVDIIQQGGVSSGTLMDTAGGVLQISFRVSGNDVYLFITDDSRNIPIYATSAGIIDGISYVEGWQNLDGVNSYRTGLASTVAVTSLSISPSDWNGIIIGEAYDIGERMVKLPVPTEYTSMFKIDITRILRGRVVKVYLSYTPDLYTAGYEQIETPSGLIQIWSPWVNYTAGTEVEYDDKYYRALINVNKIVLELGAGAHVIKAKDLHEVIIAPPDAGSTDLQIGQLYVIDNTDIAPTNTTGISKEVRGTLNALSAGAYSSFISAYNTAVETYNFDETYQVKDADRIDTSSLIADANGDYDLFQSMAVWDVNHIWNRYTIPQLNTKQSTVKVSKSSRK